MTTADPLVLFAFAFELILGLTSASPVPLITAAAPSLSFDKAFPVAAVARNDDDHLCYAPTDVGFEYGDQTHQDEIASDCEKLSHMFKGSTDQHGNITESCGGPRPPDKLRPGFHLLGSEGNCSLWFQCMGNDSQNEVTLDYGDIADVIKLATDGLRSSGLSKNSSILSVSASTQCQSLQTGWFVAFNSSESGIGLQEGEDPAAQLRC